VALSLPRGTPLVERASRLNDRDGGNRETGQVDREYASAIREIARIDPAIIRFSAPHAEGETKTHAGAIRAALLERTKEFVDIPTRETVALILDLDEYAVGAGPHPERDGGPGAGELEGVLQEVSDHRREDLSVCFDRHAVFDGHHDQSDATGIRVQYRRRCDVVDEFGNEELLSILNPLRETDLRERASDERV
jgi:hypothetical protein